MGSMVLHILFFLVREFCKNMEVCQGVQIYGKRLIYMFLSLWLIVTATFFLMRAVPGGPFTSEKEASPEIQKNLNQYYGLDQPWYHQYFDYLTSILRVGFLVHLSNIKAKR